jgi:signal transduction histidine kinase
MAMTMRISKEVGKPFMVVLDLRWVLFVLLATLLLGMGLTYEWTRWTVRRRQRIVAIAALQTALEEAPVGLLWIHPSVHFDYANIAARRFFALTAHSGTLPVAEWTQALTEDLRQLQTAGDQPPTSRYRTLTLTTEGEARTIRWWVVPWQEGHLLLALDATDQQRGEQQTRLLLSDLAHELRTPLATLLTHLEILRLPTVSAEVREQSLGFLKGETQRLVRMVNNALELGRLENSTLDGLRPTDLLTVVEEAVRQVQPDAQTLGAQIVVEAETRLPLVNGQSERLKQVLLNLLENALKYGAVGNRITVTLHASSKNVCCTICDQGPGIAPEHLPHLTRRFYRAAPAGVPGSGLGLALVAEILRQHHSKLEIQSTVVNGGEQPTGTCLSFALPLAAPRTVSS